MPRRRSCTRRAGPTPLRNWPRGPSASARTGAGYSVDKAGVGIARGLRFELIVSRVSLAQTTPDGCPPRAGPSSGFFRLLSLVGAVGWRSRFLASWFIGGGGTRAGAPTAPRLLPPRPPPPRPPGGPPRPPPPLPALVA